MPAVDANARVDNPMADLQLVSAISASCNVRQQNLPLTKIKRDWRKHSRPASAVPVWPERCGAYMEHAHVLGQYDNDIYAQFIKSWRGWGPGLPI